MELNTVLDKPLEKLEIDITQIKVSVKWGRQCMRVCHGTETCPLSVSKF